LQYDPYSWPKTSLFSLSLRCWDLCSKNLQCVQSSQAPGHRHLLPMNILLSIRAICLYIIKLPFYLLLMASNRMHACSWKCMNQLNQLYSLFFYDVSENKKKRLFLVVFRWLKFIHSGICLWLLMLGIKIGHVCCFIYSKLFVLCNLYRNCRIFG